MQTTDDDADYDAATQVMDDLDDDNAVADVNAETKTTR